MYKPGRSWFFASKLLVSEFEAFGVHLDVHVLLHVRFVAYIAADDSHMAQPQAILEVPKVQLGYFELEFLRVIIYFFSLK